MSASASALSFHSPQSRPYQGGRGIVLGATLNLEPAPPRQDVLREPVTLERLPPYQLPRDTLAIRLTAALSSLGLTSREQDLHQLWRAQTATATVMAALSPCIAEDLAASGWLKRHQSVGRFRVGPITHPYDVLEAFRVLVQLPETLVKERRFLEFVLAQILRKYAAELSNFTRTRFSFEAEAREYFLQGTQIERLLKRVTDPDARFDLLQQLHDSYSHANNYYMFSLISRERGSNEGKLFMMYCHTAFSLARIDWDGTLRAIPAARRLPPRRSVMFLFRRDRALQERGAADPDFQAQARALVSAFRE